MSAGADNIEYELNTSTEYLHIAAREFEKSGLPALANMLRYQAERNAQLLAPLAKRS